MDKAPDLEMEFVVADVLNAEDWPKVMRTLVVYSILLQFTPPVVMVNLS